VGDKGRLQPQKAASSGRDKVSIAQRPYRCRPELRADVVDAHDVIAPAITDI